MIKKDRKGITEKKKIGTHKGSSLKKGKEREREREREREKKIGLKKL